jgi:hypothetical protein
MNHQIDSSSLIADYRVSSLQSGEGNAARACLLIVGRADPARGPCLWACLLGRLAYC